jgi:hypothetical protein
MAGVIAPAKMRWRKCFPPFGQAAPAVGTFSAPEALARDAPILGASNRQWHIGSLVPVQGGQVAFEAVSRHPVSIVTAATTFSDIARLDKAPARVSAVGNKRDPGPCLGVLSHNSSVIEQAAGDHVCHRIAGLAA